ncbi:MAG TPA: ABC transporter substrate-binding protein [Candidatus Krumholzibacteria bacterium]|nr:ABC transporter substrate-binding protein [Candidatus Krumholzibacteria bacterium]
MSGTIELTLGHSPDPDDAFMFYGLAKDKLETGPYRFKHVLQDIQTLNERATRGELDITAISIHAYAYVLDKYALLPAGASMGYGYGPMVVAKREIPMAELAGLEIAVPGLMTSAYLELRLAIGDFKAVVVPFDEIIERVAKGEFAAGLIIHEGQLTYRDAGLHECLNLGRWWWDITGHGDWPLPLGGNAIHKRHGAHMKTISDILTASIRYSLENRAAALDYALGWARDMGVELADEFVGMYVNDWTLDYGERGRAAIRELLARGHAAGIIPEVKQLEFVE